MATFFRVLFSPFFFQKAEAALFWLASPGFSFYFFSHFPRRRTRMLKEQSGSSLFCVNHDRASIDFFGFSFLLPLLGVFLKLEWLEPP